MTTPSINTIASKVSPTITNMIRMDHTHVLATFHQYTLYRSPGKKQALVNAICLALDIHAQLEEEIFYPEMRKFSQDHAVLDKSVPEHNEMRRLISQLRASSPDNASYDQTVMELMRDVMHHVADEETILLPSAERLLGKDRLSELGVQMTKRRVQLAAPHAGELVVNTARSMSKGTIFALVGAFAAGMLLKRSPRRRLSAP